MFPGWPAWCSPSLLTSPAVVNPLPTPLCRIRARQEPFHGQNLLLLRHVQGLLQSAQSSLTSAAVCKGCVASGCQEKQIGQLCNHPARKMVLLCSRTKIFVRQNNGCLTPFLGVLPCQYEQSIKIYRHLGDLWDKKLPQCYPLACLLFGPHAVQSLLPANHFL